jgi:hypothetical protein
MTEHVGRLRASELEDSGDIGNNPSANLTMGEVIATRFSRRGLLKGFAGRHRNHGHYRHQGTGLERDPRKAGSSLHVRFQGNRGGCRRDAPCRRGL